MEIYNYRKANYQEATRYVHLGCVECCWICYDKDDKNLGFGFTKAKALSDFRSRKKQGVIR